MSTGVRLCGRMEVTIGDRRITDEALPGRQGRLLFALLVLERSAPVSRGRLIEALWPESEPARPDVALSALLSKLRKALGEGVLVGRSDLQLRLPEPVVVDVEQRVDGLPPLAILEQEFLPGVEGTWVEERRRELAALLVEAHEGAARAALRDERYVEADQHARQAVQLAPLRESATALVMEVAASRGNAAEGLRAYEELRARLAEELGAAPSWPVAALHTTLLAQGDASRVPLPASVAALAGAPLVGRGEELARLTSVLGGRALVEVVGEAGIGKTRLLAALAAEAGDALVLWGRSPEGSLVAYGPFRQMFAHASEHTPEELLRRAAGTAAADLARLVPALQDRLGELPAPPPATPDMELFRLLEGARLFIDRLAGPAGAVLIIDDLHWAAGSTARVLRHLLTAGESSPVVAVVAYRPDELPAEAERILRELRRTVAHVRVDPAPLGSGALEELLAAAGLDAGLAEALERRSGGNALFATELIRELQRHPSVPLEAVGVPEGVRALIERRLERLDDEARRILGVAAVMGDDVRLDVVEAAADADAVDALEAATQARLVRETGVPGRVRVHPRARPRHGGGGAVGGASRTHAPPRRRGARAAAAGPARDPRPRARPALPRGRARRHGRPRARLRAARRRAGVGDVRVRGRRAPSRAGARARRAAAPQRALRASHLARRGALAGR